MGRALRSNITLKLGPMLMLPVSIETALENIEPTTHTVCTNDHDPLRVRQRLECPQCGNHDRASFARGHDLGDGTIALVDDDAYAEATKVADDIKSSIALTVHDAAQVDSTTLSAGRVYYLSPGKQADDVYALVVQAVAAHPELAFVAEFAIRTKPALYRLGTFGDSLTLTELAWPEAVKVAPQHKGNVPEAAGPMLDTLLGQLITAFDAELYRDRRAEMLTAAVADAVDYDDTTVTPLLSPSTSVLDLLENALKSA